MIIKKSWTRYNHKKMIYYDYNGYFIFGIVPVYIERSNRKIY